MSVFCPREFPYRAYYFIRVDGILLDAQVDQCLGRDDYTAALATVDVSVSSDDKQYDDFVYTEDNTEELIEYE